jgi:hypothetical protein
MKFNDKLAEALAAPTQIPSDLKVIIRKEHWPLDIVDEDDIEQFEEWQKLYGDWQAMKLLIQHISESPYGGSGIKADDIKKIESHEEEEGDLQVTYAFPLKAYLDKMIDYGVSFPKARHTILQQIGAPEPTKELALRYVKERLYAQEKEFKKGYKGAKVLSTPAMPKQITISNQSRDVWSGDSPQLLDVEHEDIHPIYKLSKPAFEYSSWQEVLDELEEETGAKYEVWDQEEDLATLIRVDDV